MNKKLLSLFLTAASFGNYTGFTSNADDLNFGNIAGMIRYHGTAYPGTPAARLDDVYSKLEANKGLEVVVGNMQVSIPGGAKVEEKDGKVLMYVPDGFRVRAPTVLVGKENLDDKREYAWVGKNLVLDGITLNGSDKTSAEIIYHHNSFAFRKPLNLGGIGDVTPSGEISYLFSDGKYHADVNGNYISAGENRFFVVSNSGELSPLVKIQKDNKYNFLFKDNSELSIQTFPTGIFMGLKREGLIGLVLGSNMRINIGDESYHITPDNSMYRDKKGESLGELRGSPGKDFVSMEFIPLGMDKRKPLLTKDGIAYSAIFDREGVLGWVPIVDAKKWSENGLYHTNKWFFSPQLSWQNMNIGGKKEFLKLSRDEQLRRLNKESSLEAKVKVSSLVIGPSEPKPLQPVKRIETPRATEPEKPSYAQVLEKWDCLPQGSKRLIRLVSQLEEGADFSRNSPYATGNNAPYFERDVYEDLFGKKGRTLDKNHELVMLEFAGYMCPPCRGVSPEVRAVAESTKNVKIITLDAEQFSGIRSAYGIYNWPRAVFLNPRNGKVVDIKDGQGNHDWVYELGGKDREQIREEIKRRLNVLRADSVTTNSRH